MIEYWLQKKTLGGWSQVTWYDNLEQANVNYDKCSLGNSGYSWRLVSVRVVEQKLLEEVTTITANEIEITKIVAGPVTFQKPKSSKWGEPQQGRTAISPWGDIPLQSASEHGMIGKVWMLNHAKKLRARVDANSVASYEADGYVKGGPKTAFRE